MRSSVSVILSERTPDSILAYPDYHQTCGDHGRIRLLLSPIGASLSSQRFAGLTSVLERRAGHPFRIHSSPPPIKQPQQQSSSPPPDHEQGPEHDKRKKNYPSSSSSSSSSIRSLGIKLISGSYPVENNDWGQFQLHRSILGLISVGFASSPLEIPELTRIHETLKVKYSDTLLDSRLVIIGGNYDAQYSGGGGVRIIWAENGEESIVKDLQDFVSALFWVLEAKRLDKKGEKKIPLLCAPFEKKDFIGLDLESRMNKKRTYGRYRKYQGDLSLLCGLLYEAYGHYEASAEALKACNDWLWLSNAYEGLCVASTIASSSDLPSDAEYQVAKLLSPHEVIDKYREIVVHYSKYRHAGIIETESSIKAVHVLKRVGNYLLAAEFLQNIVFINLQMNDAEKIERFSALARLYQNIGFKRKSAFFRRVAAMRCVAPQNPSPHWANCYELLMETTRGYHIKIMDPLTDIKNRLGWPSLQIQILQELVGTARRMGNHDASIRHMCYLIQNMFNDLTLQEKCDFSHQLFLLTSKKPSNNDFPPNGLKPLLLPPVQLYKLPTLKNFVVNSLPSHLLPIRKKKKKSQDSTGPFLFTPIQFGGGSSNTAPASVIQWVKHEICEVTVTLFNPLPVELKVVDLSLFHSAGIEFEALTSTLVLAAESGPYTVNLLGIPKDVGDMEILGYTCTVLGVTSTCLVQHMNLPHPVPKIQVIPTLPHLELVIKIGQEKCDGILYHGEELILNCLFTNIGKIPVNSLFFNDIHINSGSLVVDEQMIQSLISPNDESLKSGMSIASTIVLKNVKTSLIQNENEMSHRHHHHHHFTSSSSFENNNERKKSTMSSVSSSIGSTLLSTIDIPINVEYSSDSEYTRKISEKLTFEFLPSVCITKYDIIPGENHNECYVILDALNSFKDVELDLKYAEEKTIIIMPGDTCRIPVPIPKKPIDSKALKNKNIADKLCEEYLNKHVQLEWKTVSNNENNPPPTRSGKVSLKNIVLTEAMMETLELSPISWDISLNNSDNGVPYKAGNQIKLIISISNNAKLSGLTLQSIDIKSSNETCIILSHSKININRVIHNDDLITREIFIIPFYSGVFELDFLCELNYIQKEDNDTEDTGINHNFISRYPTMKLVID